MLTKKRIMRAAIGVVAIFICGAFNPAAQEWRNDTRRGVIPIPKRIDIPGDWTGETPVYWMSADLAMERSSTPTMRRVEEIFSRNFAAARANPSASCVELSSRTSPHGPLPETLEEAVSLARAVFLGTVTGIDGGFYGGTSAFYGGTSAGLLLQVEVAEWIKREPDYPPAPIVYVYYRRGDFQYGDYRICARYPGWPEPPEVGDEVLLYPMLPTLHPDGSTATLTADGGGIAIDGHGGPHVGRLLAERIPEFRVVGFNELKRAVRREVRRQQEAQ